MLSSPAKAVYDEIIKTAPDLLGRIREAQHRGKTTGIDPRVLEEVRGALFATQKPNSALYASRHSFAGSV